MLNANKLGAIDPLDDEVSIETDPTEAEILGTNDEDIDIVEDEEEELFKEDEEDGDDVDDEEEVPVKKVKKTPLPKKEKKTRINMDALIKRVPQVGQCYKTPYFTIEIIGKSRTLSLCKVIAAQEPCKYSVGETFEAEEIAFYSEYYQIVGY